MALISSYYDGPVTESDRAKNLAGAPEYGVYGPDDFKVTAHPSIPYAVLVKAGRAHGHGVTDTALEDQVVQCDAISSGVRWDLIVVRRNWQPELGGPSTLEVLQAGATAEIPAERKVGPGVEDDQPIYLVQWQGGVSAPVKFIDLRLWSGNGGLYAKDELVRTYLTRVGTEVNISGAVWALQLGTNDVETWVLRTDQTIVKEGFVNLGPTNENGDGSFKFQTPFPNGVKSIQLTDNNPVYSFLGLIMIKIHPGSVTREGFNFRAYTVDRPGDGRVGHAGGILVSILARGW